MKNLILVTLFLTGSAIADDLTIPTTLTAGTPARAANAQVSDPSVITINMAACSGGVTFTLEEKVDCLNTQAEALAAAKRAYAQDEVARLRDEVERLEKRAEHAEARSGTPPLVSALKNAMTRGKRRAALFQEWREDREEFRIDESRMAFDNTVGGFFCGNRRLRAKHVNSIDLDIPVNGRSYAMVLDLIDSLGMDAANIDGNFVRAKHNGHSQLQEARNAALDAVRKDAAMRGCNVAIALAFYTKAGGAYYSGTQLVIVDEDEVGDHIVLVIYGFTSR